MAFQGFYREKRVLVTGHTGFKGAWLCQWLLRLGAEVSGYALAPATTPALYAQLRLADRMHHVVGDVRDLEAVRRTLREVEPDLVFHLAAQPLVRHSYSEPVETYGTNVMGTVNVLEAIRLAGRPCTVIVVTTDKCYENREWVHSYREEDPMGGHDPYSSSKGAAELVVTAYRRSFFSGPESAVRLASVRAGNVIGGGDWALDRIVPDCIRALQRGEAIPIRNKVSTRPWQHVLEPLSGYLWLAAALADSALLPGSKRASLACAFNFGPTNQSNRTVADLVQEILKGWPGTWADRFDPKAIHEATLLSLSIDKAFHLLKWRPIWSFAETVAETVRWYRAALADEAAVENVTECQIAAYEQGARAAGLPWAATAWNGVPSNG